MMEDKFYFMSTIITRNNDVCGYAYRYVSVKSDDNRNKREILDQLLESIKSAYPGTDVCVTAFNRVD